MDRVTIRVPADLERRYETLVRVGLFASKSEAIRAGLRSSISDLEDSAVDDLKPIADGDVDAGGDEAWRQLQERATR